MSSDRRIDEKGVEERNFDAAFGNTDIGVQYFLGEPILFQTNLPTYKPTDVLAALPASGPIHLMFEVADTHPNNSEKITFHIVCVKSFPTTDFEQKSPSLRIYYTWGDNMDHFCSFIPKPKAISIKLVGSELICGHLKIDFNTRKLSITSECAESYCVDTSSSAEAAPSFGNTWESVITAIHILPMYLDQIPLIKQDSYVGAVPEVLVEALQKKMQRRASTKRYIDNGITTIQVAFMGWPGHGKTTLTNMIAATFRDSKEFENVCRAGSGRDHSTKEVISRSFEELAPGCRNSIPMNFIDSPGLDSSHKAGYWNAICSGATGISPTSYQSRHHITTDTRNVAKEVHLIAAVFSLKELADVATVYKLRDSISSIRSSVGNIHFSSFLIIVTQLDELVHEEFSAEYLSRDQTCLLTGEYPAPIKIAMERLALSLNVPGNCLFPFISVSKATNLPLDVTGRYHVLTPEMQIQTIRLLDRMADFAHQNIVHRLPSKIASEISALDPLGSQKKGISSVPKSVQAPAFGATFDPFSSTSSQPRASPFFMSQASSFSAMDIPNSPFKIGGN